VGGAGEAVVAIIRFRSAGRAAVDDRRTVALARVAVVGVGVVALLVVVQVDYAVAAPVQRAVRRAGIAQHTVPDAVVTALAGLHDPVAAELELTGRGTAVVRRGITVVALLVAVGLPVATLDQAEARAAVAVVLVAVVALLAIVGLPVAAIRGWDEGAGRRRAVIAATGARRRAAGRAVWSVVALLARIQLAVPADLVLALRRAAVTRNHVAVVALLVRVDDPVATALECAVVVTGVTVDLVGAIVALLAGLGDAVAAHRGRNRAARLERQERVLERCDVLDHRRRDDVAAHRGRRAQIVELVAGVAGQRPHGPGDRHDRAAAREEVPRSVGRVEGAAGRKVEGAPGGTIDLADRPDVAGGIDVAQGQCAMSLELRRPTAALRALALDLDRAGLDD